MSAVSDFVGGATDFLVGGKPQYHENRAFSDMSPEEQQRLKSIEGDNQNLYNQQGQQDPSVELFRQQLSHFLSGGSSNPNPTAQQLQQASQFVDQTFTAPAQQQLQQDQSNFASQQQAQAAALGRNPNADIATQQAILSASARAGQGLQAERGARIAQQAQSLNQETQNRGLQGLQAGMQGSGFLNQLGQQAFQNRLGLLNQRSGLADYYQKERSIPGTTQSTSSGLLTNIGSVQNGLYNVSTGGSTARGDGMSLIKGIGGAFGG